MNGPRALRVTLLLGASAVVGAACYWVPPLVGPYRCTDDRSCGAGLICDDGVCCSPLGTPLCASYVFDGGLCADGGRARDFYPDPGHLGQPDSTRPRLFCAQPVLGDYVQACTVPGQLGVCQTGALLSTDGGVGCRQILFPTQDLCDGLDNNCNGQVDERPDCGGPANLLTDPTVAVGVKHLGLALSAFTPPKVTSCAKSVPAFAYVCNVTVCPQPPCPAGMACGTCPCPASCVVPCETDALVNGAWAGSRSEGHLLFFETNTGVAWDLSGARLNLGFNSQVVSKNAGPPVDPYWDTPPSQPVVLFCGADDRRFAGRSPVSTLLVNKTPTEALAVVPAGTLGVDAGCDALSGWCGYGPTDPALQLDLRHVTRVEVLVGPSPSAPPASFTLQLRDAGFL